MLRLGSRDFIDVVIKRHTGTRGKKRVRIAGGSEASTKSMLSRHGASLTEAEERPAVTVTTAPIDGAGEEVIPSVDEAAPVGVPAGDTLGA